jgi:beta-lactamase class D
MRIHPAVLIPILGLGCSSKSSPTPPPPKPVAATDAAAPAADAAPDPLAVIRAAWPDGCFTALDGGTTLTSDPARCAEPHRPYSTFKIPNALIALDAGVLAGADAAMTWDKKKVPDQAKYLDAWRKPHTLRTGMAVSAVPYFRTLALQIGAERMKAGLARLGYGNQDMSGGPSEFWLTGGLRITADQQLAFMTKLADAKVDTFAAAAQMTVRDVLKLDEQGGAVLRGKTGSGPIEDGQGGWHVWLVGWVETACDGDAGASGPSHRGDHSCGPLGVRTIPFAAWLQDRDATFDGARAKRDERVRATLAALGWIAAPAP